MELEKKRKKPGLGLPKVEVDKKKIVIKLGHGSSSESADDVRKTHSMSQQARETKSSATKDDKRKKTKSEEQFDHFAIIKKFLDEKDDRKWNYFVDNLGKKDRNTLKKLLCAEETSSEVEGKKMKRKKPDESSTEDKGKNPQKKKKRDP